MTQVDYRHYDPVRHPETIGERLATALQMEKARRHTEHEAVCRSLDRLQEKYRASRRQLLGDDVAAKLRGYVATNRRHVPEDGRLVVDGQKIEERRRQLARSRSFMDQLRIDRAALTRLHENARRELEAIVKPRPQGARRFDMRIRDHQFDYVPGLTLLKDKPPAPSPAPPPPPPAETVEVPPFAWWDRDWYAAGDGDQQRLDGYLRSDIGQTGSCVWRKNSDAGDFDVMAAGRENGFLVPFTPANNSILKVEFDIQCSFSEHCIETYDEWGWSDYTAWTNEESVVSVFWDWPDGGVPMMLQTELRDPWFVWGLDGNGDGESYPGVVHPVPAGQTRTITVYTDVATPKGVLVWVYVGTAQKLWAFMNDVTLNSFTNAAWFITRIRVTEG